MKQATGSNSATPSKEMSIRLRSGGHSFPKELPAEYAAADRVVCSVLTHKTLLVPAEVFERESAPNYLALAGLGCAETECAVYSDPQRQQIAVMAVDKECRRQLAETAGDRVTLTSPLLFQPKFAGQGAWLIHTDGLLYTQRFTTTCCGWPKWCGRRGRPTSSKATSAGSTGRFRSKTLSALPVGKRHTGPPVAEVFQGCTMRIISGRYKEGRSTLRRICGRVHDGLRQENLFNVLTNLVDFEQCDVLTLFSGTGSISYEFASRGARSVTAVEINAVHYNFIRQTARELGCETIYPVKANAFLYLKSCPKQFDIVFSDAVRFGRQRGNRPAGAGQRVVARRRSADLRTLP